MSWKPDRYAALRALLRGGRIDEEVQEEFEHHLAERIATNQLRGMSADAAREDAIRRFGDVAGFRRRTASIDESILREQKRMEFLDTVRREVNHAWRSLRRSPGFSVIAIVTLALGIGASTAVYTLLNAVVLNPLPYPNAERLVFINHGVPGVEADAEWGAATATYFHYLDRSKSFESMGAYWPMESNLKGATQAAQGRVAQVTASFFPTLGATPQLGRLIVPDDDRPGQPRIAVLSHEYWQREFGGRADILGQTVEIEGSPTPIVGVTQPGFQLPEDGVDVFLARRISREMEHQNWHHLSLVARLRPGITPEAAEQELKSLANELPEQFPTVYTERFMKETKFQPQLQDLRRHVIGNMADVLWIVLGSVVVVLLIAVFNVANLVIVRVEGRRNEQAVRTALGAERAHIAVQSLSESLLFSMMAGVLGLWLAHLGLRLLLGLAPELPRVAEVGLGRNAFAFAFLASVSAGLVFGAFPLLRSRVDYRPLREGGRGLTTSRGQFRVRSVLVITQIALAMVLLAAAGLMLRSFQQLRQVEPGFSTENVLAIDVAVPFVNYDSYEKVTVFWRRVSERLAAIPGVTRVGAGGQTPLGSGRLGCAALWVSPNSTVGQYAGCLPMATALPGMFEALGIKVTGRTPQWSDIDAGTGAIVITRALAERFWPGEDPMGRGLRGNRPGDVYFRVVGVAEGVRMAQLDKPPTEMVWWPTQPIKGTNLWGASNALTLFVRTAVAEPEQLMPAIRSALNEIDPSAAIGDARTMKATLNRSLARQSFTMILLGLAGFMALALSVVGLYGVIAYVVSRRRSELGIRMALGATNREVARMVVLQSLAMGAVGVIVGLIAAALTTQVLTSLLYDVKPTDPVTLTAVSFFLMGVAALASFIPARRAARVSPIEALKAE